MTWVIGMPGFATRGVLIADVRVTLSNPDRQRPDRELQGGGVQKIHAVSGNIAVGFAGNVDTGMLMVGDMARCIRLAIPPGTLLTEPSRFLLKWARRALHHWEHSLDARARSGGCDLLAIAALPRRVPEVPINATVGWIMRSPRFDPERIPNRTARSIGSGEHVPEYAAELEALGRDFGNLVTFDTMYFDAIGGPVTPIAVALADAIEKRAAPGISPHLVVCSVRFGEIAFGTNDVEGLSPGAPSRTMPPIATTWAEWQSLKRQRGLADRLAVA
jgi:hypothetical protein